MAIAPAICRIIAPAMIAVHVRMRYTYRLLEPTTIDCKLVQLKLESCLHSALVGLAPLETLVYKPDTDGYRGSPNLIFRPIDS
ncbi:MAG: hypothetical protein J7545_22105 [Roseofilum sp. SBFL]|uniref:hypothetical protein n=1 Tax=unclassified Roseofilum TaxID=2620099 RepID=UPI001B2D57D8|nr:MULTISPECIES: hypothetical protein [unclassified Roseofilum]MBP0015180.1 hypothetical protein [Roseofilum sp. SID3]MBP0024456.1 hypothetical protein [Roseofilum sp. SID2]MBP0038733.1 hypothetical protein [Roseofilum sp. SID1]MBP0044632.1 hypothetical protein [Roseofilum sp. SBFL]